MKFRNTLSKVVRRRKKSWYILFRVRCSLFLLSRSQQINLPKMENEAGELVDTYCPRKCSASNRIIHAKDHASIQMNIVDVDSATGRMTDTCKTYAICGAIRRMGESDDCITRLAKKDGVLAKNF